MKYITGLLVAIAEWYLERRGICCEPTVFHHRDALVVAPCTRTDGHRGKHACFVVEDDEAAAELEPVPTTNTVGQA